MSKDCEEAAEDAFIIVSGKNRKKIWRSSETKKKQKKIRKVLYRNL